MRFTPSWSLIVALISDKDIDSNAQGQIHVIYKLEMLSAYIALNWLYAADGAQLG